MFPNVRVGRYQKVQALGTEDSLCMEMSFNMWLGTALVINSVFVILRNEQSFCCSCCNFHFKLLTGILRVNLVHTRCHQVVPRYIDLNVFFFPCTWRKEWASWSCKAPPWIWCFYEEAKAPGLDALKATVDSQGTILIQSIRWSLELELSNKAEIQSSISTIRKERKYKSGGNLHF